MSSWDDVERIASTLPNARPGVAHEGSPTFNIGRHPFARLRWADDGRQILQFWSDDLANEQALAEQKDIFFVVHTFTRKVSIWAWLDRLDEQELTEILTDSHRARRGARR